MNTALSGKEAVATATASEPAPAAVSLFREAFEKRLNDALLAADDLIFEWAARRVDRAYSEAFCIDTMRSLRIYRTQLVETWLTKGVHPPAAAERRASEDTDELSLVADAVVERDMAVRAFVATFDHHCTDLPGDLVARLYRFAQVAPENGHNPRLAWHAAMMLREGAEAVQLDVESQGLLFKLVERTGMHHLRAGYAAVDQLLTAHGLAAAAPQPYQAPVHKPAQKPATGAFSGASQGPGAPAPGSAGAQAFVTTEDQNVSACRHIPGEASDLGVVQSLLSAYMANTVAQQTVAAISASLSQPLMRIAQNDAGFVSNPRHPIRELLQAALGSAGVGNAGGPVDQGLDVRELYNELEEIASAPVDAALERSSTTPSSTKDTIDRAKDDARHLIEAAIGAARLSDPASQWLWKTLHPSLTWFILAKGHSHRETRAMSGLVAKVVSLSDPEESFEASSELEPAVNELSTLLRTARASDRAIMVALKGLRRIHADARYVSLRSAHTTQKARAQSPSPVDDADEQQALPPEPSETATDASAPPPNCKADAGAIALSADPAVPAAPTHAPTTEPAPPAPATEVAPRPANGLPAMKRRREAKTWLASHARPGEWWRVFPDGAERPIFARLMATPAPGKDFVFFGLSRAAPLSMTWRELLGSIRTGRSRPLHPNDGFLDLPEI